MATSRCDDLTLHMTCRRERRLPMRGFARFVCLCVLCCVLAQLLDELGLTATPLHPRGYYDAVVLDSLLLVRNGDELCRDVRRHDDTTVVVSCTGALRGVRGVLRELNAGFDIVLTKPFGVRGLRVALIAAKSLAFRRRWSPTRSSWIEGVARLGISLSC